MGKGCFLSIFPLRKGIRVKPTPVFIATNGGLIFPFGYIILWTTFYRRSVFSCNFHFPLRTLTFQHWHPKPLKASVNLQDGVKAATKILTLP